MGMFDTVAIPLHMLPLKVANLNKLKNEKLDWQTKSMENLMVTYTVTPKRELWLLDHDWESVPNEEKPYPDDDGLKGLMGSIRTVRGRHEKLNYTGILNFYTHIGPRTNYIWFEFDAIFENGIMIDIKCIQPTDFIDPEIKETFSLDS